MKYRSLPLFLQSFGAAVLLAAAPACGGSSDEPSAPAEGQASAPAASRPKAEPFVDKRTPAEIATPAAIPEEQRTCPSPYRPDVSLDMALAVDGEPIGADAVKRLLCTGFGSNYFDYAKFQVLIDQELERRKAAGEDISKYVVDDAAVDKYLARQREEFLLRYPTLDFEVEVGRAYISYDIYREPARQSIQFDRLFLPDDPAEWPALTTEVIRGFGGDVFIQDAFDSYARRKQHMIDEGLDELPREDPVLFSTYKGEILRTLHEFATIETFAPRLPQGVLAVVEGKQIPISLVWDMIAPYVSPGDIDWARRFLVITTLLERDLAERGTLLTREEFEKVWPEPEGMTFHKKLDQYQLLYATATGMNSAEAYAIYSRLFESMRAELAEKLEDEALLREWSPITNVVTGISKRALEVILVAAWDGDLAAWKPDGWSTARAKAIQLKAELDGGADWTALRELHSEFWDPPMPETGHTSMYSLRLKGAFAEKTRSELMNVLEESESFELIRGKTVTDTVFYEQPIGSLLGPLMGPKGYYITRVTQATPPMRPLDMTQPIHRKLVQNFYLRAQLVQRSHELLLKAVEQGRVQGL